ncbi:chromosome partitioning protein, ParB family [Bradyrhizobium brasilense]|uniref:Chromosome partitioning protein, ParB family n=1 Tax=Bradyrhizobium brasilense TaxID=1419277 RepID=A0A1G6RUL3_9BRAD|nr:hypothetical protein [Bradyrhizobium brasilense]SDD08133.1 chromosome partitioning protein, ParB family [Bradyrhizobium brasilense]
MAKEAERLLVDTGRLPEPLRLPSAEPVREQTAEDSGETAIHEAKPSPEDEEADDAPRAIAAE